MYEISLNGDLKFIVFLHGKMERWLLLSNLRFNISGDVPTECFSSRLGGSKLVTEPSFHLCMQEVSEKPLQEDQRCLWWCTSKMLVHKLLHTHQKWRDEPFPLKIKFSSCLVPVIRAKVESKKILYPLAYTGGNWEATSRRSKTLVSCTSKVHVHMHGSGAYIKNTGWAFPLKAKFSSCLISSVFVYIKAHVM